MMNETEGANEMTDAAMRNGIEIGTMISIPAWRTFGMIVEIMHATHGSDDAIEVMVQENPESETARRYHLEPGEYQIEN
jgi:hypothetical protein